MVIRLATLVLIRLMSPTPPPRTIMEAVEAVAEAMAEVVAEPVVAVVAEAVVAAVVVLVLAVSTACRKTTIQSLPYGILTLRTATPRNSREC